MNGILPSIKESEGARECAAILVNDDVWHGAVIGSRYVSSILRVKFKFSRVKVFGMVAYDPTERNGEKREMFWIYLIRVSSLRHIFYAC